MKQSWTVLVVIAPLILALTLPAEAASRRGQPDRSFQVRWGGFFVEGDSNFWADNEALFTHEASDFDDTAFGVTYSHAFNRFLELDVNLDFYDEVVVSEYINFVDGSGFPILHESILDTTPVTLGLRLAPFGRAKAGSKRPVLFVGGGAGVNLWSYQEVGDFIDFSDPANPIVFGNFKERDNAFVAYGLVGLEVPVTPGFNLGFEARYFDSEADLDGDFAGLGTLDLSGYAASVSANWRF